VLQVEFEMLRFPSRQQSSFAAASLPSPVAIFTVREDNESETACRPGPFPPTPAFSSTCGALPHHGYNPQVHAVSSPAMAAAQRAYEVLHASTKPVATTAKSPVSAAPPCPDMAATPSARLSTVGVVLILREPQLSALPPPAQACRLNRRHCRYPARHGCGRPGRTADKTKQRRREVDGYDEKTSTRFFRRTNANFLTYEILDRFFDLPRFSDHRVLKPYY
jgi:hypothetical protein